MKCTNKELPINYITTDADVESEQCRLISSTSISREPPSEISSATASSSSVDSTRPLLNHKVPKISRANRIIRHLDPKTINNIKIDMSRRELNMVLGSRELDPMTGKKPFAEYGPCEPDTISNLNRRDAYIKQGLAAFSVSLGALVIGFACAYTSPALESMKDPASGLNVTEQQASWIGSLMPLSALIGGIVGGPLIEILGRKKTILITAIPQFISNMMVAMSTNVGMIMAGRSLTGFSIGIATVALPVYLGETIQPNVRGTLGLLPTALGNSGILICFLAGKYIDWSQLALFGATLAIPYFILMFFIPETPRWYIGKKNQKEAKKSLEWLRGKNADINEELNELQNSDEQSKAESASLKDLFNKKYLKPFAISLGLMFFQQLSGINAVIFYTVSIFEDAGSTIDSNLSSIIVGLVNLGSTLIATALIDRLGRKMLMYISNGVMALTLFILGLFFYLKNTGTDMTQYGWLPLASFVIYVIGFSVGSGPIPWLMMGEILPVKVRGTAASVVTGFNWACTFVVTKTFIDLTKLLGSHGAFWLFGVICTLGLIFVIICVPETRGKSLEEIERFFTGEEPTKCVNEKAPSNEKSVA